MKVEGEESVSEGRRVRLLGDGALLLDWPALSDSESNRKARSIARHAERTPPPGFQDCVVGARSLLVVFDPLTFDRSATLRLSRFWENDFAALPAPRTHEIPVCYGGAGGIDLEELAAQKGMGASDFARLHSAAEYRVAFLGFAPGFAYLTGLSKELSCPRLSVPRVSVPWGSVAIGGSYTGVYPASTPGGWRLIGRTPVSLFDSSRVPPSRLAAGDRVRFVPIEEWRFAAMAAESAGS